MKPDKATLIAEYNSLMDDLWALDAIGGDSIEQITELRTAGGPGSGRYPKGSGDKDGSGGGSKSEVKTEFSKLDAGADDWKSEGGWEHTGITWDQPLDEITGRPIPIKVKDVIEAAALALEGKVVEVPDVESAATVIKDLAEYVEKARAELKASGGDPKSVPDFDLCNVSVAESNMFCSERLQAVKIGDKTYEDGVPRLEMPQLGGSPVPGTEADREPRVPWNADEVDGADKFVAHLQGLGIQTKLQPLDPAKLKASQRELVGTKVAAIISHKDFANISRNPIFVSNDGYIVDGHHRWAAIVGEDARDGKLGDSKIQARVINAPITEVLHLANAWASKFGIKQNTGVVEQAKNAKVHADIYRRQKNAERKAVTVKAAGSASSGNFGHAGRPGQIGGSSSGSGGGGAAKSEGVEDTTLTPAQQAMQNELAKQKKKPLHKVKSAEEAVELLLEGENVEIQDIRDVHTVLAKLGQLAIEAKAKKENAPNFDPCGITVKGASLFCTETIKTEKFPNGIPRIEMPQFKSKNPVPGSEADKLPRKDGEVDASGEFLKHLEVAGVKATEGTMLARKLKASQAEMEGAKVAGMMLNENFKAKEARIWVSRDGYVIDGHHTWAAAVGRDAEDGNLDNDMEMKVTIVDLPMSQIYKIATNWTLKYGMPNAGVKK